jgi:regulator of cell morphogenesis and NO signaling
MLRTVTRGQARAQTTAADAAALVELAGRIADRFHASFRESLPRLEALARRVLALHGRQHPVLLISVGASVLELRDVLLRRIDREEEALLPAIRAGLPVEDVVRGLRTEEVGLSEPLRRLRELTHGYDVVVAPSAEWGALWRELALFDAELTAYLRLERDCLFPRLCDA